MIKKLELCLMVVSVLLKTEFGHTQISVPKIGIPMLKAACVNPCFIVNLFLICFFTFLTFVYIILSLMLVLRNL